MDRLSDYPHVIVRISCPMCKRFGSYRLARLAAKFGPEAPMDYVLAQITYDCPERGERPRSGRRRNDERVCHARFSDLEGPPRPPDLPAAMSGLRLVAGGKDGA